MPAQEQSAAEFPPDEAVAIENRLRGELDRARARFQIAAAGSGHPADPLPSRPCTEAFQEFADALARFSRFVLDGKLP
jgi:hypothetical protein